MFKEIVVGVFNSFFSYSQNPFWYLFAFFIEKDGPLKIPHNIQLENKSPHDEYKHFLGQYTIFGTKEFGVHYLALYILLTIV